MPPIDSNGATRAKANGSKEQQLDAELWFKQLRPLRCTITKLAANQVVFVSLSQAEQAPHDDYRDATGKLIVLNGNVDTPLCIAVRVNHHTRERWVLEPLQGSLPLLVELKTQLQQPPRRYAPTSDRLTPYQRRDLFEGCQWLVEDFLHGRLAGFYSEVDDQLLRAAASDPDHQHAFQDAMKTVVNSQTAFEAAFNERVLRAVAAGAEPDFIPQEPDFSQGSAAGIPPPRAGASLFSLGKQAAAANQAQLDRLALHFSLAIQRLSDPTTLPFGPLWLCRHFGDTLDRIAISDASWQILHKVFRDTILGQLKPLFGRLESGFAAQGAIDAKQTSTPPVLQQPVALRTNAKPRARAGQMSQITPAGVNSAHALRLLRAASELGQSGAGPEAAQLRSSTGAGTAISADELKALSKVYDAIVDDGAIADEARPLLRQIKTPLLGMASSDPRFWREHDYPPRCCLNLIAQLCQATHYRGGPVKRQLPSICDRIQREWKVNCSVFNTLLPLLIELKSRQLQTSERNVQRLSAKQDGHYRLQQAQADVANALCQRFEGQPFPGELHTLLAQGWQRYMVHVLLNQGQRDTFQRCLDQLSQLHQALLHEPATAQPARRDAARHLLKEFLQPLEAIGLANVHYQQTLAQLDERLRQPPTESLHAPPYRAERVCGSGAAGKPEGIGGPTGAEHPATAAALSNAAAALQGSAAVSSLAFKPGEWVGWLDNPDEQAMQLAWSAPDGSHHVFVDQAGLPLLDMNAAELAMDRALGLQRMAAPLEKAPLEDYLYRLLAGNFASRAARFESAPATTLWLGPNALEAELAKLVRFAGYSGQTHALIGLKLSAGHGDAVALAQAGDRDAMAASLAAWWPQIKLPQAILARLEADYYALLVPYTNSESGRRLMKNIHQALARLMAERQGEQLTSGLCCGLISVTQHSSSPATLLKQLRTRCQAVNSPGDQDPQGPTPPLKHPSMRSWIPRLGEILTKNRLKLRIQATVALGATDQRHHEILLGVLDDLGQVTLPGDLIAAAELHHRMDIFDRWILQHAFQWLHAHPEKAQQLGRVHLNISGNALQSRPFLAFLLAELDRGSLPNDSISFELSESTAYANLPRTVEFITRVRAAGCHLVLDNFGKGRDSLELLKHLPVDMIKIDRSYCRRLPEEPVSASLLNAMALAAHSLGMTSCAQGVENETVLNCLEQLPIDFAQGYGVSKPMLLDEI